MGMSKVSLIIPAYNAEKFITQCLRSIASQSYRDIEVIIVNDGSSDSTEIIVLKFVEHDDRFRYIKLEHNVGVNAARAIGLCESKGEYIGFVDADDWIDEKMVACMLHRLDLDDSDIVICGVAYPDDKGNFIKPNFKFKRNYHIKDGLFQFTKMRFGSGYLWNKLYRRGVVFESASYECHEKIISGEDYIINVGAFHKARSVSLVPGVFYYYRQHFNSATKTVNSGEAFARLLRAYYLCLERYSHLESVVLDCIDGLYQIQFGFDCYKANDLQELFIFRKHIEKSLSGIMRIRPESIYPLIHSFERSYHNENTLSIGANFQKILKAISNIVMMCLPFCNPSYICQKR
jgi:glycosyltransferase involved in cell wall biosynthesis